MRTNYTGFALTVGMGLIVILLGFLALSTAGLVGFSADEASIEETMPMDEGPVIPKSNTTEATIYIPASVEEAEAIRVGDALFKANCTQCHAVNEKVVGPALVNITKRRSMGWIVPWVRNSAKVIASGDDYAVKLFNDNGKQQMPSFPQLSDKEIKGIMAWIASQEGKIAIGTDTARATMIK